MLNLKKIVERKTFMNETSVPSLSMISHELKNPLTLIYSTLQMIGNHYPDVQKDPLWTQVLYDVEYMSQLLSELSSLNSSQIIHYSNVNIRQILTNILYSFSSEAQTQKKELSLKYDTSQMFIIGDAVKIQELFMNLVKNAMDATDAGDKISIHVKCRCDRLTVTVSDTGCGIDSERISTIYEPFVTYKPDGTGLGLAIVKNIVMAHNGLIHVYSKLAVGTKFLIILPVGTLKNKT